MCCLAVLFTACDDMFASEDNPTPAYLSMSTSDVTIKVDGEFTRKAIAVTGAVIEYSSNHPEFATVDQQGTVKGIAEGEATITAKATGYNTSGKKIYETAEISYKVIVKPNVVIATNITLSNSLEVMTLTDAAITITATPTPSAATINWSSSDEAVATVVNGEVTPVGKGLATITAQSGDVKATCEVFVGEEYDLATVTADATIPDGSIVKGTLGANVKISIADGAAVVLNGVTINGVHGATYTWAGINCVGDATIILKDGSTNYVRGFHHYYPGIHVPGDKNNPDNNKTLTIKAETAGTGSLEATGSKDDIYQEFWGAGIGGVYDGACGNIVIQGGIITAYGDEYGAGIGSGGLEDYDASCGNITITGGTITATGGKGAAGIGCGQGATYKKTTCGTITITDGVTKVTATKGGGYAPNSIGTGRDYSICGTVTIGGTEYWDGTAYQNGGDTYLTGNITYTPTAP